VPVKAKELRFAVEIDCDGRATADDEQALGVPEGWSAEHLVLAGLVRCTLTSFRHAASRRGVTGDGYGRARGVVTRRDDGRFAFVEIDVDLDVSLEPRPDDGVEALLEHAQRGCFIGNSLIAKPTYRWKVNGASIPSAA
jgi:organic hydroperoxide reductase OsmC/OhrA